MLLVGPRRLIVVFENRSTFDAGKTVNGCYAYARSDVWSVWKTWDSGVDFIPLKIWQHQGKIRIIPGAMYPGQAEAPATCVKTFHMHSVVDV